MPTTIDYYLTPQSPWTYLGHARFAEIARRSKAVVNVLPVDLGKVFPVSGGLPLPQRAPQRQAYRLIELRRFADHLRMPMHLHPAYFPVAGDPASKLITVVRERDGAEAAMTLAGAILRGVWAEERNIADPQQLAAMLAEQGLPAERLEASRAPEIQALYDAASQQAIERGIFGAPSYVIEGELFWGQDRLDFVERRLA